MRITPFTIFSQLTGSLDKTLEDYSTLNSILSNGKKIQAPSDDVIGMMRALDYKVSINSNGQYQQNIDQATAGLNVADTVLTSLSDAIGEAKQLVNAAANGTPDPELQTLYTQQANQLRDQFYSLGNTTYLDHYMFSGFLSDTPSYAAGTFAYQGDAGVVNAPIDKGATVPVTITGAYTFSYTLAAASAQQISGGRYVHYTPGAGTTVNVQIRDTDDVTVLDNFSFSNVIQMTDQLSSAVTTGNSMRIQALVEPFNRIQLQVNTVQADVGSRLARLKDQSSSLTQTANTLKTALSSVEDADMIKTFAELKKTEITLQSLRDSSARILSQSLLDFLR